MDVVSSVSAVAGLVFNFATVIKACNDIRGRYKDADRTIESIRHELETLHGALEELLNLMMHDASALTSRWDTNKSLSRTFEKAVRGFRKTIKGLQDDIKPLQTNARLGKMDKVKLLWNDDGMKEHLGQLRAQSSALQLLLLVLQTGSISDVKSNLHNVEAALNQLSKSSNVEDGEGDEAVPAYRTDVAGPSHILDQEEDLLDLDRSVVSPDLTAPSPHPITADTVVVTTATGPESMPVEITAVEIDGNGRLENPTPRPNDRPNISVPIFPSSKDAPASAEPSIPKEVPPSNEAAASKDPPIDAASSGTERYDPRSSLPALIRAVYRGDIESVNSLIAAGNNIEARHPKNHRSAVMIAAYFGDFEILELLLKSGAIVNTKDRHDRTALHYAASEGMVDCVNLLLSHAASPGTRDSDGKFPLHCAIQYGQEQIVKILLPLYADPLKRLNRYGETILHTGSMLGDVSIVKLLLESLKTMEHRQDCPYVANHSSGCDCPATYPGIDAVDYQGYSPLQLAMRHDCLDVVSLLLPLCPSGADSALAMPQWAKKASDSTRKVPRIRPLHYAVALSRLDLLQLLLNAGANVNLLDSDLLSPLGYAIHVKSGEGREAAKILLAHGADYMSICPTHRKVLLEESVEAFSPAILDDIVMSHSDIDLYSSGALRAVLFQAQLGGRWETVRKLVVESTNRHLIGKILDEQETIFFALLSATPETIAFLVQNGANIDLRSAYDHKTQEYTEDWRLPIHVAAGYGRTDMATVLLENGASLLSKAGNGWLPIHPAVRYGDMATVKYFLERTPLLGVGFSQARLVPSIEMFKRALKIACKRGSVDIVELLSRKVKVIRLPSIEELHNEAIRTAVQFGRKDVTEYLLKCCSFSPTTLNALQKVKFDKLDDEWERSRNHLKDYEACKVLVANAMDCEGSKGPTKKAKRRI